MLLRSTAASISRARFRFRLLQPAAERVSAPATILGRFRPPSLRAGRTCVRFCFIGSHRGLLSYSRVSRSALRPAARQLLWPRLTSGDSSQHLSMPVALRQTARSPRVLRTHLHAYACRIYVAAFRASTGLCIYWPAHPAAPPLSASCSSGQRFAYSFLQIPPRDGHPCRSANTSPCRVCRGLSPPSECALPGAPKRKRPHGGRLVFWLVASGLLVTPPLPPTASDRYRNLSTRAGHRRSPPALRADESWCQLDVLPAWCRFAAPFQFQQRRV